MKLRGRLVALERTTARLRPQHEAEALRRQMIEEEAQRLETAWQIMRGTMSEEHAEMVLRNYQLLHEAGWDAVRRNPAGRLFERCFHSLMTAAHDRRQWPYNEIALDVLLAMPPVLADIYLTDPSLQAFHDCEDCGFKLPIRYFKTCPLCGGNVEWYGYWTKHKAS